MATTGASTAKTLRHDARPATRVGDTEPEIARRRRRRREAILDAAIELFDSRGFAATSVDEIGAAAGISGPAIYQYFKNKDDILVAAFERSTDQMLGQVAKIVGGDSPPWTTIEALVEHIIALVLDGTGLLSLVLSEGHHLPREARQKLDDAHRIYVNAWTEPLRSVRPDLSESVATAAVEAILWMALSADKYSTPLQRRDKETLLLGMAMAALEGASRNVPVRQIN